jgi:hypothetical protein
MSSTDELLAEVRKQTDQDPARGRDEQSQHRERASPTESRSLGARFRESVFSPRAFVLSLLVITAGLLLANAALPLDALAGLVGVFAAAFGIGLLGKGRYREVALAGGVAAGVSTFFDYLLLSFVGGFGVSLAAAGVGAGLLAAAVGFYFGRDLRAGLTMDL